MKITAQVISVQNNTVSVKPLQKEGCRSCSAECAQKSNSFVTANPFRFKLNVGDTVLVENSKKTQAVQGLLSLIFPLACAVAGFFLFPKITALFGMQGGDKSRALGVLIFLLLSSLLVYVSSRTFLPPERPQITSVLTPGSAQGFSCSEEK